MAASKQDRRRFLSAVFFSFGGLCGILTARCCSEAAMVSTVAFLRSFLMASTLGACMLSALAAPILLLLLGMSLFGSLLIPLCVCACGFRWGWVLGCIIRGGEMDWRAALLLLCAFLPQTPCLLRISDTAAHLSAGLRAMVLGRGLRRPDFSSDLRSLAICFFALLLSAALLALCFGHFGIT